MRKSANDEVSKRKDDIFDMYLEEPDWSELLCRRYVKVGRAEGQICNPDPHSQRI